MNPPLTHEQSAAISKLIGDSMPPGVGFITLVFFKDPPADGEKRTVGLCSSVPMPEALHVICSFAEKAKGMMP